MTDVVPVETLRKTLLRIDGKGYKAYTDIRGTYRFPDFVLAVEYVQADPFAPPSRLRVVVPPAVAALEARLYANTSRAVGISCFLARAFARQARELSRQGAHSGPRSPQFPWRIEEPGQQVLANTAVQVHTDGTVEARFSLSLPAQGRRVLGRQAAALLTKHLPQLVSSLYPDTHHADALWQHAATNEDADMLRALLAEQRLVAFIADDARLARASGVDDRPLQAAAETLPLDHHEATPVVVPFQAPDSLRVTFTLPHAGKVTGMGIPAGVTLIVGGGYHGKSTVLRAIERGVYNHRPGDGREQVVSVKDLVKIRAEDGRSVSGVDISPLINHLPLGHSTHRFSSGNASGSTSQAAAIVEALEAGASGLLIDEDTAATNFMIRDARMQTLVPKEQEPITSFIDRVRHLWTQHGISSILVIGGSGDYLDVADTVIAMQTFQPQDVTARARTVAAMHPSRRTAEADGPFSADLLRRPQPHSVNPSKGRRSVNLKTRDRQTIQFGTETIDLSAVEQIIAWPQTRAIAAALAYARQEYMDGQRSLAEILELVLTDIEQKGLDVLDSRRMGDFAHFRGHELAAALNRLRTLKT